MSRVPSNIPRLLPRRFDLNAADERLLRRIDSAFQSSCRECEATNQQNDALFEQLHLVQAENAGLWEQNRRLQTPVEVNQGFTLAQQHTWFGFGYTFGAISLSPLWAYGLYMLFQ